jgi:hypothetical protein
MAAWTRETPWRQGHVLTAEASIALGLVDPQNGAALRAMVISHDCDLAQDCETEPVVEVIVGKVLDAADGNLTHAKNSRRLHLSCEVQGAEVFLDLPARGKAEIVKEKLADYEPDEHVFVTATDLSVLQRWLAARYRRSAFPDEFERRMNDTGVTRRLVRILEPLGNDLVAVFFDVDEGAENSRQGEEDVYSLGVELLYSTEEDPNRALASAERAAEEIRVLFRSRCFVESPGWRWIELIACEPISDQAMTYAMSLQLKRWNVDYLSLRAEPPAEPLRES